MNYLNTKNEKNIPLSTQWTLDAAGEVGRTIVDSVFMIFCKKTRSKGTGFCLKNGYVITNEHVIRNCNATEIFATSASGHQYNFSEAIIDPLRDLAALKLQISVSKGLTLGSSDNLKVGSTVITWGYPLMYDGPSPLLSVGYLSGFLDTPYNGKSRKHLVVNGAFNPGNSGGALFQANDDKVIGVVVNKHAPITKFQASAIEALARNRSGVVFSGTDENGKKVEFVESQLVADLLTQFRKLTQVMIGEAICVSELKSFLEEHKING